MCANYDDAWKLRLNYYELARQFDFQAQDLALAFAYVLCPSYIRFFFFCDQVCPSHVWNDMNLASQLDDMSEGWTVVSDCTPSQLSNTSNTPVESDEST